MGQTAAMRAGSGTGMRSLTRDPSSATDLRRRRTRDECELLCARADWLPSEDAALVRLVFGDGKSALEVARVSGKPVDVIRRRLRRLVSRTLSAEFIAVVRFRDEWTRTRRAVGDACFVRGLSIREAGSLLGLSIHTVRQQRDAIRTIAAAARRSGKRA